MKTIAPSKFSHDGVVETKRKYIIEHRLCLCGIPAK